MLKKVKFWLPLAIYSGIIFYLSSISSPELPKFIFADKLTHILEYFLWGVLAVFAIENSFSLEKRKILLTALLLGVIFSASDEMHQLFVIGREFSYFDLFFDFVGLNLGSRIYL